jgi:hypothetical protein
LKCPNAKDKPRFGGPIGSANVRSELDCSNTKSKRVHCRASNTSVICCVRTKEIALEVRPPLIGSLMKKFYFGTRCAKLSQFWRLFLNLVPRSGLDCSNAKKQTSALLGIRTQAWFFAFEQGNLLRKIRPKA